VYPIAEFTAIANLEIPGIVSRYRFQPQAAHSIERTESGNNDAAAQHFRGIMTSVRREVDLCMEPNKEIWDAPPSPKGLTMDKILRHPVPAFTLDEQGETSPKSTSPKPAGALFVSDVNLNPVTDPQELEFLAGLVPFHHIPTRLLFKVVRVATGLEVRDRWVAVRAIIAKRIPIPVAQPLPGGRHGWVKSPIAVMKTESFYLKIYNAQVNWIYGKKTWQS
jgi:hypothetical protein